MIGMYYINYYNIHRKMKEKNKIEVLSRDEASRLFNSNDDIITKLSRNNNVINIELHKHIHINTAPKKKSLPRYQKKCIVCGNLARMTQKQNVCSNTCLQSYRELKYKNYQLKKKDIETRHNQEFKKKWWEF